MKLFVYLVLSLLSAINAHFLGPMRSHSRHKRDAVGALDIVTNNGQPIHAEVKNENGAAPEVETTTILVTQELHGEVKAEALAAAVTTNETSLVATEKPCPKPYVPAAIEMGTVFQVTPPKDVSRAVDHPVHLQSGRKSWPLGNRLDLIKSVSRTTTVGALLIAALVELYPLVTHIIQLYK